MSFLQPWILIGLPLISLPIIIHLINQRRFQSIHWGAMMFLLAAHRMARGYSRLRQWLIMFFRVLAVATLLFAASRPLASGWLGLAAGGQADTTIILLDRSPSMEQRSAGTSDSKLDTGRKQLRQTFETLGSSRWVLIDSATREPRELESPGDLLNLPNTGPASASADLPLMLHAAHDYIRDNRTGQTEIWICSDLQENDWTADSARWSTLREAFLKFPQTVRFHLLAYPQSMTANISVRVTEIRRQATSDGAELHLSLTLSRQGNSDEKVSVPVQFEIEGARSVVSVELTGTHVELRDHVIPIERTHQRGWGRVSIPADANPADNEFYFAFDDPPPRRTILVAEDPQAERPLQLIASISPDPAVKCSVEVVSLEQLPSVEWDEVALVLWQAPLPTQSAADLLQSFVERGGQVAFFPPRIPDSTELFGIKWQSWTENNDELTIATWRGDEDLLVHTLNGAALPVGQLEIHQSCGLLGEFVPLASLRGGALLLARVPTKRGGIYFWATTPSPRDSSLATGGVVLYAFVHRSLAAGAEVLGKARQLDAGEVKGGDPSTWNRLSEGNQAISTEFPFHRGVYLADDQLLAINRSLAEDNVRILADERTVVGLFHGLDFDRVDDQAGNLDSLIQEIWRAFLIAMLAALIFEAVLCLPKLARPVGATA